MYAHGVCQALAEHRQQQAEQQNEISAVLYSLHHGRLRHAFSHSNMAASLRIFTGSQA
jgi:hypothetical protein